MESKEPFFFVARLMLDDTLPETHIFSTGKWMDRKTRMVPFGARRNLESANC